MTRSWLLGTVLLGTTWTSVARAEATVDVRILDSASRPVDGKVTIRGPKTLSCSTTASRCSIRAPKGKYEANVESRYGKSKGAKQLSVPGIGNVKLVFTLDDPEPAAAPKSAASATVGTKPASSTAAKPDPDEEMRKHPPGKNLELGKTHRMAGRVLDSATRPADALVVIFPQGKSTPLGHVRSIAGRFNIRDLPPGTYVAKVYGPGGGAPLTQTVRIAAQPGQVVIKVK